MRGSQGFDEGPLRGAGGNRCRLAALASNGGCRSRLADSLQKMAWARTANVVTKSRTAHCRGWGAGATACAKYVSATGTPSRTRAPSIQLLTWSAASQPSCLLISRLIATLQRECY